MYQLASARQIQPTFISPDQPLRIGIFTDFYTPQINGVAVVLRFLVQALRADGHQVTVFAPQFPDEDDTEVGVQRLPAVCYMQMPPVYLAVPGTPRITLALHRCQFDVVHVHSPLSLGVLAYLTARSRHVPLVYTYHTSITDYTHYIKLGGQTRPVRQAAQWYSTTCANLCDHVVVPSAKFKRVLLEQNVRRPIQTIPNGIDLMNFHRPAERGKWRARLNLDSATPILVYVGRLAPEKRLDILIASFARIAVRHSSVQLVIAGDGSSRSALEAQAAHTGCGNRIHFLGMVDRSDIPALLQTSTLFVSASTSETQCLAMVEAIAAGLPVVAAQDEAFDGILIDGVNGRAAQPEADIFSETVCDLLADEAACRTYGQNSIELSRKFSIEAQALALTQLYRNSISSLRTTQGHPVS